MVAIDFWLCVTEIQERPNVLVMTTRYSFLKVFCSNENYGLSDVLYVCSNITEAIDLAFVDR
jgi:hypothetical protein